MEKVFEERKRKYVWVPLFLLVLIWGYPFYVLIFEGERIFLLDIKFSYFYNTNLSILDTITSIILYLTFVGIFLIVPLYLFLSLLFYKLEVYVDVEQKQIDVVTTNIRSKKQSFEINKIEKIIIHGYRYEGLPKRRYYYQLQENHTLRKIKGEDANVVYDIIHKYFEVETLEIPVDEMNELEFMKEYVVVSD